MALVAACILSWPVTGPVIDGYAPEGRYGGHWGVDIAAEIGIPVRAPAAGTVVFAGSVAGMRTVSIDLAGDVRVSLSYLSEIAVRTGVGVERGDVVGRVGLAHGVGGLHLSVRLGGLYRDPLAFLGCRIDVSAGLRLVEPRVRPSWRR